MIPDFNLQQHIEGLDSKEIIKQAERFRDIIREKSAEIFYLGSGFLVLSLGKRDNNEIQFLYDPSIVTLEFFTGKGETIYSGDSSKAHRLVADSAFSKAQPKRQHRSPYFSGRFSAEWGNGKGPKEVHFPVYSDDKCVIGYMEFNEDGDDLDPHLGKTSYVPILEKTADVRDIIFVPSEGKIKGGGEAFSFFQHMLSPSGHTDYLEEIVKRVNKACSLRQKAGEESVTESSKLFC